MRPVLVVINVDRIAYVLDRCEAEISRVYNVTINRNGLARAAFQRQVCAQIPGDDTVVTRGHLFEDIDARTVRRGGADAVWQVRKVGWTSASIQFDRHVRNGRIGSVEAAIEVCIDVDLVTDLTGRRVAEVSRKNSAANQRYILTSRPLQRLSQA